MTECTVTFSLSATENTLVETRVEAPGRPPAVIRSAAKNICKLQTQSYLSLRPQNSDKM